MRHRRTLMHRARQTSPMMRIFLLAGNVGTKAASWHLQMTSVCPGSLYGALRALCPSQALSLESSFLGQQVFLEYRASCKFMFNLFLGAIHFPFFWRRLVFRPLPPLLHGTKRLEAHHCQVRQSRLCSWLY